MDADEEQMKRDGETTRRPREEPDCERERGGEQTGIEGHEHDLARLRLESRQRGHDAQKGEGDLRRQDPLDELAVGLRPRRRPTEGHDPELGTE